MKLTVYEGKTGFTQTAFQNFMEAYDLKLLTIKVQCPECGHTWGIKIDDFDYSTDIPEKKFKCGQCGHYHSSGNELSELEIDDGTKYPDYEAERVHIKKQNGYLAKFA